MAKTLSEAISEYKKYLLALGKTEGTVKTYGMDLAYFENFIGGHKALDSVTAAQVGKFMNSDILLLNQKSGEEKHPITICKNIRVVRQFLLWLQETGQVTTPPLPKAMPVGLGLVKGFLPESKPPKKSAGRKK